MITKDEGYLDQYKEIYILSEKEKSVVSLVMDEINKRVAVKKVIRKSRPDIYHVIKGLASEHIPKIYHILEEKDNLTIIEEYVEGSTLQEYLQSENILTADRFFDLLYQICEVLELLHGLPHPIIHRDIKPSNIIVTSQGLLKLIDYDSAREYKKESDKDTVCLGTIEYASPEQFGYSQTDMRSDIYSVGILISACMKYNLELETKPRFKTAVQKVIDRCTMFDPLQRYQNMNELEKDLRTAQKKLNTRNRRRYTVLFASGLSCLLVLAALYYNWQGHNATTSDQSMTDQVTDGEGKVPGQKNTADDNVSLEADKASTEDIISLPVPNNFGLNQDASVSNTDIITEPVADNTHTADA